MTFTCTSSELSIHTYQWLAQVWEGPPETSWRVSRTDRCEWIPLVSSVCTWALFPQEFSRKKTYKGRHPMEKPSDACTNSGSSFQHEGEWILRVFLLSELFSLSLTPCPQGLVQTNFSPAWKHAAALSVWKRPVWGYSGDADAESSRRNTTQSSG